MSLKSSDILEIYKSSGALLEGHFLLSSGNHSDTYLQSARVLERPEIAQRLAHELCNLIKKSNLEVECICSPAIGGLLAGYELARAFGVRFIFTERVNGVMTLRRGFEVQKGERVLICEDILTTGGSALEAASCIESAGGVIAGFSALINRGFCQSLTLDEVSHAQNLCKIAPDSKIYALANFIFDIYAPQSCPLCAHSEAIKPGSRGN